jgi:hypothetical protein
MERAEAEKCVDAIFEDLRDRRFLKWLFAEHPEAMGPILHDRDGTPLMPLDRAVQSEMREAWIAILMKSSPTSQEKPA